MQIVCLEDEFPFKKSCLCAQTKLMPIHTLIEKDGVASSSIISTHLWVLDTTSVNFMDVKKRHVRTSSIIFLGQAWLSVDILYAHIYILILNNYEFMYILHVYVAGR